MSDRPEPPADDIVELASRYVDGDLSVDERAAAEADPEVMGWVERFGGVQVALREPIEVDAAQRDAAVAAALAAFGDPVVATPPGVGDLAAARARRSGRMAKWLGAAAAVMAVAIGGVVLARNSDGGDDSADSAFNASAATSTASAGKEPSPESLADEVAAAEEAQSAPLSATAAPAPGGADTDQNTTGLAAATTEAGSERDASGDAGGATDTTTAAAETTAATGTTTTASPAASVPAKFGSPSELAPLSTAAPVTMPGGAEPPCFDVASGVPVATDVDYEDQPAVIYRDDENHTLTAWATDSCVRLDDYRYPDE